MITTYLIKPFSNLVAPTKKEWPKPLFFMLPETLRLRFVLFLIIVVCCTTVVSFLWFALRLRPAALRSLSATLRPLLLLSATALLGVSLPVLLSSLLGRPLLGLRTVLRWSLLLATVLGRLGLQLSGSFLLYR